VICRHYGCEYEPGPEDDGLCDTCRRQAAVTEERARNYDERDSDDPDIDDSGVWEWMMMA